MVLNLFLFLKVMTNLKVEYFFSPSVLTIVISVNLNLFMIFITSFCHFYLHKLSQNYL